MKRIFSLALGNIWSWTASKNRDDLIKYAKKLDVSGVEITFAYKEEIYAFKLSTSNRDWLRQLDYVTIHAPFRLIRAAENEKEVIKQLDAISRIYKDINAKAVIIHPGDLPAPEILRKYDFNILTENLAKKSRFNLTDLRKTLSEYPNIRLCLDVSHAYLWSKYETDKLINMFKDRISQVHFSGNYRKKNHQSLRKVSNDFLESIQPIKELNVPIVIEEDIKIKSLKYLKEEVEYIKNMFD
ncbi:MAG: TIM barrel protein [Nanoarchaeota archaeon]|nr:TIM barrel protein [Nanoarchaeota archaeon]